MSIWDEEHCKEVLSHAVILHANNITTLFPSLSTLDYCIDDRVWRCTRTNLGAWMDEYFQRVGTRDEEQEIVRSLLF
jgi:hypothetical protein